MQEAVNKNQEFHSAAQSLSAFLINLPDNKVRPGESVSQVYAKQNSQMVSIKFYCHKFKKKIYIYIAFVNILNDNSYFNFFFHNIISSTSSILNIYLKLLIFIIIIVIYLKCDLM